MNIINLRSDQAEASLSSWWGKESLLFGRLTATITGVCGIACGLYLIAAWFNLPGELMNGLGQGGYLLGLGAVMILFATPMILAGMALLVVARSIGMTPRVSVFLFITVAVLGGGASLLANNMIEHGIALQAKIDALIRKESVESFVSKMNLSDKERRSMITETEALSDVSLCMAAVLPMEMCQKLMQRSMAKE